MLKKTLIVLYLTMMAAGIWWTRDIDSETGYSPSETTENTPVFTAPDGTEVWENTPGNTETTPTPTATKVRCWEDQPCWGDQPTGNSAPR